MRPNRLTLLMLLIVGMLVAGACGPAAPAPTPTVAPSPAAKAPPAPTPTTAAAPTVAPSPAAKPSPAGTPTATALQTVKVGDLGYTAGLATYIAFEKGYFREQGIDVKFERLRSGPEMVVPLSTGELQVGDNMVLNASLFNAVARGIDVKVIATVSRGMAPADTNWWMIRTDLKDQIKTVADFKGRIVNMLAPASTAQYALAQSLAKYGLTEKDLKTELLSAADTAAAFKNKAIDISIVVEPNVATFAEQGLAIKWRALSQDLDPFDVAVVVANSRWLTENPELAKKYSVAYLKGIREYVRAARGGPNRPEVVSIGTKYALLKDAATYDKMTWPGVPDDGYVDKESIKKLQTWLINKGDVPQAANIDTLVDNSLLESAKKVLGEFKE